MKTNNCHKNWLTSNWIMYTTKIDGVVCPPNISETVAGRLMKLAHRPRIASTMIKLIPKPILLPILLILVKTIQRIVADRSANYRRHLIRPTPFPVSVTLPRVRAKCYRYLLCFAIIQFGWPRPEPRVWAKRFSQSEFSSTTAAVATFRLDRFRNHSHSAFSCVNHFSTTGLLRCDHWVWHSQQLCKKIDCVTSNQDFNSTTLFFE